MGPQVHPFLGQKSPNPRILWCTMTPCAPCSPKKDGKALKKTGEPADNPNQEPCCSFSVKGNPPVGERKATGP